MTMKEGAFRHGRDDDFVDSRVDVTSVVRQSVTVEIVQRDGGAHTRDPGCDAAQRWIDFAGCLLRFAA